MRRLQSLAVVIVGLLLISIATLWALFLDLDADPLDPVHFRFARVQLSSCFYGGWNPGGLTTIRELSATS